MIYIGQYEEFSPERGFSSMRDSFANEPYKGQGEVAYYLTHGKETMCRMELPKDVFTGERINMSFLFMTDGEYTWPNILSYYVKKYNLRLPKDFEKKILDKRYGGLHGER